MSHKNYVSDIQFIPAGVKLIERIHLLKVEWYISYQFPKMELYAFGTQD
jgi:hypothetical protein